MSLIKDQIKYTRKQLITASALAQVLEEREQQDTKWGEQNHTPFKWCAILGEETGEVNKAALEKNWKEYRAELVQVAAVAVAAIESFDRATCVLKVNELKPE